MSEFAIIKTGYHGGQFEGNECNVILNNFLKLTEPLAKTLNKFLKLDIKNLIRFMSGIKSKMSLKKNMVSKC